MPSELPRIVYRKSPFRYGGTYATLGFALLGYYIFSHDSPGLLRFFTAIIVVAFVYGVGVQQFYFILTEKALIVRNHWFLWINKEFTYESIERVYFENERPSVSQKGIPTQSGILFFSKGERYVYVSGPLDREDIQKLVNELQARTSRKQHRGFSNH